MKHKIQKVELFVGVIILLGGLLTYGLGVHQLLPVPRPDLVVYGTTLIGIILIFMGCDIFSKPTKEMQILENDERNVEDEVDVKIKIKLLYEKMKDLLKDRERKILELRFGLGGHKPKTQNEIAQMMGISRSYVSRIETKAIGKLAKEIKE